MEDRTIENYCKTIMFFDKGEGASSSQIAKKLRISKISVSITLKKLRKDGYIIMKPYQKVKLSQKGKEVAEKIAKRYELLLNFLEKVGVERKIAEKEACAMEHILSESTIKKISNCLPNCLQKKKK
ncbi:MAG: metal-dependent transcriptional regulator [Candidatus Anstonellaceae archaeon]